MEKMFARLRWMGAPTTSAPNVVVIMRMKTKEETGTTTSHDTDVHAPFGWARIGCKEDMDVQHSTARGRNNSAESGGYRRYSTNMPSIELADTLAVQVQDRTMDKQADADILYNKLEDFLAQVIVTLSQALLPTPPKKLGSLFKQQLSPSTVRVIKELVTLGGGQVVLNKPVDSHGASTSVQ
ncbi:hypothetical protein GUJ93_ZPchr0013g34250 [Zizania palustris]|uniref:Uncharacterized protein n=1 Tax=Zizania palustris TaxID=103762 RepID=A0A8J6C5I3_ZIZPA|nr:hypothetical protein GUJ93_ZPchr0013g34250 [Zizania palustris]